MGNKRPVVFISYSHDSTDHKNHVWKLAEQIQCEDIECITDRDAPPEVHSWPRWLRLQIQRADYVLMVFTHTYRRRFDGLEVPGKGRGATWEGLIIENTLYAGTAGGRAAPKFIPVVFQKRNLAHIPTEVFCGNVYVLPTQFTSLRAHLKPPLGLRLKKIGGSVDKAMNSTFSQTRKSRKPKRILSILFIGEEKGTQLDLKGQYRKTKAAIEKGRLGMSLKLSPKYNVTPDQLLMEISATSPDVLHLSGKQEKGQVLMCNDRGKPTPVSAKHLTNLFSKCHQRLRMVILDTCWSLPEAQALVREPNGSVDFALGVEAAIADPVAIDFYAMFYNAIASGSSVHRAYTLAHGLELAKIEGNTTYLKEIQDILSHGEPAPFRFDASLHLPQLVTRRGIDPKEVYLL